MVENIDVKFQSGDLVIEGTTYIIPPNPELGYACGYSIFVPKGCEVNTTLLMHSCNTDSNNRSLCKTHGGRFLFHCQLIIICQSL